MVAIDKAGNVCVRAEYRGGRMENVIFTMYPMCVTPDIQGVLNIHEMHEDSKS